MSRPLDPGALERHMRKVPPPVTNRRIENALGLLFLFSWPLWLPKAIAIVQAMEFAQ